MCVPLLEPKMCISKPNTQNACLVIIAITHCPKVAFSNMKDSCIFILDPRSCSAKTQIWFVILSLVILSIIHKLTLFLLLNPNFTQISTQKNTVKELEKNFSTLYAASSSIARSLKEESHCAGSSGSSFFSFRSNFNQPNTK